MVVLVTRNKESLENQRLKTQMEKLEYMAVCHHNRNKAEYQKQTAQQTSERFTIRTSMPHSVTVKTKKHLQH